MMDVDVVVAGALNEFRRTLELLDSLIIIPILIFAALLALAFVGSKVSHRRFQVLAVIATLAVVVLIVSRTSAGSIIMLHLTVAFVMTSVVFILRFVKLTALDYAIVFACFVGLRAYVGLNTWIFGTALPILYVFVVIFVIYKIRSVKLTGQIFHAWFAAVLTALMGYTLDYLFGRYILTQGQALDTRIEVLTIWGIVALVGVALNFAIIYAIKRIFGKRFLEINEMGRSYPRLERFFIYNSVAILLLMMVWYYAYGLRDSFVNVPNVTLNLFTVLALVIQLSFLILIFRITRLKDNLKSKTLESRNLADYSSSLEQNMSDIKSIKHDIKNIFITMGSFIEKSDNEEMKAFFREKISPFVNEEIAKNDLFDKLTYITDEHLKAVLYYKVSQAVEYGIAVDLDISPSISVSSENIEFIDLVRILGILFDNAVEECMTLEKGVITIKLTQNDVMDSYMIKNTISRKRKETGIVAGISSKNGDRGKGLLIVRGILDLYDCITLNSYFIDDCFVQSLIVSNSEG